MQALLDKGLNVGKQTLVWKASAKKVLELYEKMTPEQVVDCLKCLNWSGLQDDEFW
jgi:hypothetical protein